MSEGIRNWLFGFLSGAIIGMGLALLFVQADSRRLERSQQELRRDIAAMTEIVVQIADIIQDHESAIRWNRESMLKPPDPSTIRPLGDSEKK